MNSAKVVIIGTGPSGIAAATKLLELGFQNVTLLEAENRIGGRINTIPFAKSVVDLGAQWCHGQKDNVVYELAGRQQNLLEHSDDYGGKFQFIRSNGDILNEGVKKRLQDVIDSVLDSQSEDMLNFKGPLGSYVTDKYFRELQTPENSDIDATTAKEYFENFQKFQNAQSASDCLSDLSTKDYSDFWKSEGDNLLNWKGKGYISFLQLLMKSTETRTLGVLEDRVKLNKPVKLVNWSDRRIIITCEDGEVIEADHVIVTVSLGVLKQIHSNFFKPKLPEFKARAIETIGFGTIDKIFLEFPRPFWPDKWGGFALMWTDDDLKEIRGTSQSWLEDVFVFMPVKHQPNILNAVVVGEKARHMESLSKNEVIDGCVFLLRKFLKLEIPAPINCATSSWFSNKNFRGSYSHRSFKAEQVGAKPADLASPFVDSLKRPMVLFAGEATSDHHFSTVHGAVESGWREAQRLADFYRSNSEIDMCK